MIGFVRSRARLVELAVLFTGAAFAFSLLGFLHPEPAVHFHEYAPPKLAVEVAGHFLFGFAAALPLMDMDICLLVGSMAVLIDIDHLLASLGFGVSGRPDHSFAFAVLASLIVPYLARRLGIGERRARRLALVGFVVVLSHIAYDTFSSAYIDTTGVNSFPLLLPFSFGQTSIPGSWWPLLEACALLLSGAVSLLARCGTQYREVTREVRNTPTALAASGAFASQTRRLPFPHSRTC